MTCLWAVNSLGKVFTLSTTDERWMELKSDGMDFKKVSAHEFFTWAIGGDHQIYIYVPTRDVPIRCRVVTYENERWNPFSGFTYKLLPTDRPHWSSADGLVSLPQENFHLPSKSWEWEEEWYVDDNLDGQPLEPEGWMYAADFPANYGPSKIWNSCVRRRKWIRYRRFCATNKWALIPSIHEDPVLEPFIDVAIGGTEIPGGEPCNFTVWAVTIMGNVLFRYGVTESSPEGSGWVPIKTPDKEEVHQISVGRTGLVWAVTWSGTALARIGVTRENIMGNDWVVVDPPTLTDPLTQITVGIHVVWALSKENKVWFRKGINGLLSGENDKCAVGFGWIEMVGNLTSISVGIDDQVFGINADPSEILLRTGVNSSELFGRIWKTIEAPFSNLNHSPSSSSLDSMSLASHRDSVFTSDSISLNHSPQNSRKISRQSLSPSFKSTRSEDCGPFTSSLCEQLEMNNIADTNSHRGSHHSINNRTDSCSSLDSESYYTEKSMMFQSPEMVVDSGCQVVLWICISASGCSVIADSLPFWFSEGGSISKSAIDELWYGEVISQLKERHTREVLQFPTYPKAIEQSTWVKTVACRFFKNSWVNCTLELMQHGDNHNKDTLTCHYNKKEQVSIQVTHITGAVCLPDGNKSILVIHTAKKTTKGSPYKFSFTSNDDLEDWLAALNTAVRNVNNLSWIPDKTSAWSLTVNGDVYVHKAGHVTEIDPPVYMKWSLIGGGHLRIVESCPSGITWGVGYNCLAWTYNKGYGGGPFHGIPGSNSGVGPMSDMKCLYIYENQRWNPYSGFTSKGLPTDRYMWSDQTGRIECTKGNMQLPSCHWQWISNWCIDYKTPGGVDNEGWQYATDFPRSYHGYKRFTDYVRRRRWYRKCKLSTTGPWQQLGKTRLLDVSFQVEPCPKDQPISVWAVAFDGEVMSRVGVTESCPKGLRWEHVPSEKSFRSISVGGNGAVWGIAEDGSAQLRHGICEASPIGQYWCHIEPPQVGCHLRQISAGKTRVLAIDDSNRLWSRQEIVPVFMEGTHWKLVSEDVKQVSIGPMDQVWCIKNNFTTPTGVVSGIVCRRRGITEENPCGTNWEQGIGGCWAHVSMRGCLFSEQE